jgi:hypothetical protein
VSCFVVFIYISFSNLDIEDTENIQALLKDADKSFMILTTCVLEVGVFK